jgi:D-sedoheptulose 7-phosphate isomerase
MREHVQRTAALVQEIDLRAVGRLVDRLVRAYENGERVFIFGNGGSAATASHFCEDLAKSTIPDPTVERRLRVVSLTDSVPFISALGNDWGFDLVFREQLRTLASPGDVAIAISGSGNSPNVISAVEWAVRNGLFTVGLCGFGGGKLKAMVELPIHCAVQDMEIAENAHMVVAHLAVGGLRRRIASVS